MTDTIKDLSGKLRAALGYDRMADEIQTNNDIAEMLGISIEALNGNRDEVWGIVYKSLEDDIGETAVAAYITMLEMYGNKVGQTLQSASEMLVMFNTEEVSNAMEELPEVVSSLKVKGQLH